MKKVSVIIPCYNATKWLPKCFISLANQTIGIDNMELIFVNDASTDDMATWNMLLEFERAFPESVIVIDSEVNKRQGGARNEGIKYASGEYVGFVDADDFVVDNMFEKAYKCAKDNRADIVQFGHDFYFEKIGIVENPKKYTDELIDITNSEKRKQFLVSEKLTYGCWNKLYKKEMLDVANTSYAEGVIYEEPLFVYPLLYYCKRVVIMSDALYIYRQNALGTMRSDMKERETLKQHADVQFAVWEFMKNTEFFNEYYEEIKLYFLHTYLYETLDFAKKRNMKIDMDFFMPLAKKAAEQVEDMDKSIYEAIIKKQMSLYRNIKKGITQAELTEYINDI